MSAQPRSPGRPAGPDQADLGLGVPVVGPGFRTPVITALRLRPGALAAGVGA